jgi:hypothetical protein
VVQANREVTSLMTRKEKQEVLAGITTTLRGIPIRDHIAAQVHPLSESMRGLG